MTDCGYLKLMYEQTADFIALNDPVVFDVHLDYCVNTAHAAENVNVYDESEEGCLLVNPRRRLRNARRATILLSICSVRDDMIAQSFQLLHNVVDLTISSNRSPSVPNPLPSILTERHLLEALSRYGKHMRLERFDFDVKTHGAARDPMTHEALLAVLRNNAQYLTCLAVLWDDNNGDMFDELVRGAGVTRLKVLLCHRSLVTNSQCIAKLLDDGCSTSTTSLLRLHTLSIESLRLTDDAAQHSAYFATLARNTTLTRLRLDAPLFECAARFAQALDTNTTLRSLTLPSK